MRFHSKTHNVYSFFAYHVELHTKALESVDRNLFTFPMDSEAEHLNNEALQTSSVLKSFISVFGRFSVDDRRKNVPGRKISRETARDQFALIDFSGDGGVLWVVSP